MATNSTKSIRGIANLKRNVCIRIQCSVQPQIKKMQCPEMEPEVTIGFNVLWVNAKVKCARPTVCVYGNDQLTPGNHLLAVKLVSEGRCISCPLTLKRQIGHNPTESGYWGYWEPITRKNRNPRLTITRLNRVNRVIGYQ